jgi:hypothetical protein
MSPHEWEKFLLNLTNVQGLKCQLGEHTFAFIYCICALNQTKAQEISNKTVEIDYLLGDLNLNAANPTHRRAIDVICGEFKKNASYRINYKI